MGLGFGAYPFDRTIVKPLCSAAVALAVEVVIQRHVATTGIRVPLIIVGGLCSYLTTLVALGLAPEERRLAAAAVERFRARRGKRGT